MNFEDFPKNPCDWCGELYPYPTLIPFNDNCSDQVCVSCAFKEMESNSLIKKEVRMSLDQKIRNDLHNLVVELTEERDRYKHKYELVKEENSDLRNALEMWKLSFYCDGETKEKSDMKCLRFNQFVEMVEKLRLDG